MMDLQTAARRYLGVRFHHQGRQPWALDCAGLALLAAQDIGREFTDIKGYPKQPDGETLKRLLDEQLTRVYREPRASDVLLMRFKIRPQHIAIKTDKGIIHAYEGAGCVVEHELNKKWKRRIVAVYEL